MPRNRRRTSPMRTGLKVPSSIGTGQNTSFKSVHRVIFINSVNQTLHVLNFAVFDYYTLFHYSLSKKNRQCEQD